MFLVSVLYYMGLVFTCSEDLLLLEKRNNTLHCLLVLLFYFLLFYSEVLDPIGPQQVKAHPKNQNITRKMQHINTWKDDDEQPYYLIGDWEV